MCSMQWKRNQEHSTVQRSKKQEIPVPPYEEQLNLVRYLDKACEKLDTIQSMKRQQLGRLGIHVKCQSELIN